MSKPIINALLISAGFSGRMGEFKPLIKIENQTFVSKITEKLLGVCETVTIVTGYRSCDVEFEINSIFQNETSCQNPRIKCVFNHEFSNGMFSSVKAGVAYMQSSDWILFHFVDQPAIPINFYNELIDQIDDKHDWIQPVYELKQGHPVMFNNSVIPQILNCPSNYRMKLVRAKDNIKKKYWITDYKFILEDFDTKEDLMRIHSKY
ncbi:MAG: 4-diphosphocytidyl-2C-methyl-D-erythritol synthase [Ignavibacteria bacterium]|nr:MAG: 4-diphosphocytidyl-2C-methyl-D-erythritol synthase [Ignavibacteria bacterium]KAF0159141.1 MAG: 4-diphosphocytidyl-2C-methyl-D-erythritol synthase [Ignavibacteria bacterium]